MTPAATDQTAPTRWRKSSHSTAGNDCVEVASTGAACAIRDSKIPAGGHITISPQAWRKFTNQIKQGTYDL
jgi:hypothetical protein